MGRAISRKSVSKRPRLLFVTLVLLVPLGVALLLISIFSYETSRWPDGLKVPAYGSCDNCMIIVEGCLVHQDLVNVRPGQRVIIDVLAQYSECNPAPEVDSNSVFSSDNISYEDRIRRYGELLNERDAILVGSIARVELLSPLLPGKVEPLVVGDQVINGSRGADSATWSWEIAADKPGDYILTVVASVVDPDSGDVALKNPRSEIRLHVEGTLGYYVGTAWRGLIEFMTSLQGLITGGVAALLAALTLIARLREKERSDAASLDDPTAGSGYL